VPPRKRRPAASAEPKLARLAGLPAVEAVFATAPERVERLFFDARMKAKAGAYCAVLARARKPYRLVAGDELERVAGSVMHGGIVALARPVPLLAFDAAEARDWARDGKPLLLLDGVSNPQNLGAIARSAAFFGLPRMILSDNPAQAGLSDAAYRIAEGGLDYLRCYRASRFAEALKRLREHYRVIGTAPGRGSPIDVLGDSDRPPALVLGNEERGLPQPTLAACEAVATIPGAGPVQSLNVAASAAILIHALLGRRRKG